LREQEALGRNRNIVAQELAAETFEPAAGFGESALEAAVGKVDPGEAARLVVGDVRATAG
jgi:hypothetical protein